MYRMYVTLVKSLSTSKRLITAIFLDDILPDVSRVARTTVAGVLAVTVEGAVARGLAHLARVGRISRVAQFGLFFSRRHSSRIWGRLTRRVQTIHPI